MLYSQQYEGQHLAQLVQCLPRVLALQDQTPSVDPLSNWYIKGHGMCCPLCQKGHIKDPLILKVKCIGFLLRQQVKTFAANVLMIIFWVRLVTWKLGTACL